ncbi:MAG: hypothetical protein ACLKAO_03850 [Alkaliphilus sp.]
MVGARKAIESLYSGLCTITEYQPSIDPTTGITSHNEVDVAASIKCRLSFKHVPVASEGSPASTATQRIKLFLAPELQVKPGSKITVTQNGVTIEYSRSSEPATYSTHQEIILEVFKGWL